MGRVNNSVLSLLVKLSSSFPLLIPLILLKIISLPHCSLLLFVTACGIFHSSLQFLLHISRISPPACHGRQIWTVVKEGNLMTCHRAVDLWVDQRSTICSVTAQEANSCSGHKPFDAVAFVVWLLKSYFLIQNEFYFKIPLQDNLIDSTVGYFFV